MTRAACCVALLLSFSALARPRLLDDDTLTDDRPTLLADYHGAAPLGSPVRPVNPVTPVRNSGSGSLFLLGLGLTAGGLVLGAGGFAVLYVCRDGTACHSDATTVIGWVLAAPGLIPLTVGLIMMYVSAGGSGRVATPKSSSSQGWAFGFTPLKDGAFVSAATAF